MHEVAVAFSCTITGNCKRQKKQKLQTNFSQDSPHHHFLQSLFSGRFYSILVQRGIQKAVDRLWLVMEGLVILDKENIAMDLLL